MIPFSKRYNIEAIDIENSAKNDINRIKRKIWDVLIQFNEYNEYQVSRYDRYTETRDMFGNVRNQLIEFYDVIIENDFPDFDEDFFCNRDFNEIFDILEFWYSGLTLSEKNEFQKAINKVFQLQEFPWLLVEGHVFKIDSQFIDREIVSPLIEKMSENNFYGALNEFAEAQKDLMLQDYKGAIHNSCKSFESTLKTVLGKNKGSAKDLLDEASRVGWFSDLPEELAKGFGDKVFMILPFLRNRLGGHGQGEEVLNIDLEYAKLAINLSASFNLFFINRHVTDKIVAKSKIDDLEEEIPF